MFSNYAMYSACSHIHACTSQSIHACMHGDMEVHDDVVHGWLHGGTHAVNRFNVNTNLTPISYNTFTFFSKCLLDAAWFSTLILVVPAIITCIIAAIGPVRRA